MSEREGRAEFTSHATAANWRARRTSDPPTPAPAHKAAQRHVTHAVDRQSHLPGQRPQLDQTPLLLGAPPGGPVLLSPWREVLFPVGRAPRPALDGLEEYLRLLILPQWAADACGAGGTAPQSFGWTKNKFDCMIELGSQASICSHLVLAGTARWQVVAVLTVSLCGTARRPLAQSAHSAAAHEHASL